ncbi:MAG: hypothetical protein ACT4NU_05355 [Chromatiales bacterium]
MPVRGGLRIGKRGRRPDEETHDADKEACDVRLSSPGEYGLYSNLSPVRDQPRWSQKKGLRIGEFLKRDTLSFNGYADPVARAPTSALTMAK